MSKTTSSKPAAPAAAPAPVVPAAPPASAPATVVRQDVPHTWAKGNVVTRGKQTYTEYECSVCHTKGRSTDDGKTITLAPGFYAKAFRSCDTAARHRESVYARRAAKPKTAAPVAAQAPSA